MRVLFAAARFPLPLDTGAKIRTFHLLSAVAQKHEVVFLCPVSTDAEREAVRDLRDRLAGVSIETVDVPAATRSASRLAAAAALNLVQPLPLTWMRYQWPALRDRLAALTTGNGFDLVHCDHVQIAPLVLASGIRPGVIDAHNIESALLRRVAHTTSAPARRLALEWQAWKTRRTERRLYRSFDRALTCSAIDRDRLRSLAPSTPITVVPNGVDTSYFAPMDVPEEPATLAFVGSMDWAPNIDAVRYFVRDILPGVRARCPSIEVRIIGRNAPADLAGMDAAVHVTGTVPDVRPLMAAATLVIVPLRSGGGTRLKILEAWAMRKAVISTSVGAEGLGVQGGRNIVVADSPDEFGRRILQLLADHALRKRIAGEGHRSALEHYDWARIGERLRAAYDEVVTGVSR
jgi:glycosyltransferase involved in cell wall biosynthesis